MFPVLLACSCSPPTPESAECSEQQRADSGFSIRQHNNRHQHLPSGQQSAHLLFLSSFTFFSPQTDLQEQAFTSKSDPLTEVCRSVTPPPQTFHLHLHLHLLCLLIAPQRCPSRGWIYSTDASDSTPATQISSGMCGRDTSR